LKGHSYIAEDLDGESTGAINIIDLSVKYDVIDHPILEMG